MTTTHARLDDRVATDWTGRVSFDLVDVDGWRFGIIEFALRVDLVTAWWATKSLAVFDRARLRRWLRDPHDHLTVDDLTLSVDHDRLAVRVHHGPLHVLPIGALARLRATV